MSFVSIVTGVGVVYGIYYIALISYDLFIYSFFQQEKESEEEEIYVDDADSSLHVSTYEDTPPATRSSSPQNSNAMLEVEMNGGLTLEELKSTIEQNPEEIVLLQEYNQSQF